MMIARFLILSSINITILAGCSIMDFIPNPFDNSGLSVDTEIVAGDKEIATEVTAKKETTNTTNTADIINQPTINEAGTDYFLVIFALIGWILPSPRQLWLMAKSRLYSKP